MIKRLFPLIVMAAGLFASCASDDAANGGTESTNTYDGVVAEVLPMEDASQGTRSSLSFHPQNGMIFAWNAPTSNPDVLTVFPESGMAAGLYTLSKMLNANNTVAQFTATGFSLTKNMRYYALSKNEDTGKHPNWKFPSAGNITVDYSGQRQAASGDNQTSHLGEYDFMAATALCEEQDQAYFAFKHLGLTLRMILKGLPAGVEYTELEIYDSENTFRQPIRTIDLTKGLDGEGNYTPAYNELDVNSDSYKQADRFKLALGSGVGEHPGITPTADDGGGHKKLIAYMELPPFDFTGKDIVFFLKSKDGTQNYYGTYEGYKLNAGKAYQMTVNMKPATTYIVNVKVAYNWQLGNTNNVTLAKTRATGDPGFDDSFEAPNYIYAFFCVDGKVKTYKTFKVGENSEQSNNILDAWTAPDQNNVITYKTPLTFSVTDPAHANTARVYIAASKTALNIPAITEGTLESYVNTMTYSIPGVVDNTPYNVALDASQQFLRDLYSTPWEGSEHAATFEGALKDPYHDILLYHVAAKVDLKWNTEVALPTTGENAKIKVNNVLGTGLSIFQPTTNTWAAGSYNVSTSITDGTKWNGRQVYYLPQFANSNCKYNVTIGSNVHDGTSNPYVTFSPATTSGYTSWLRWVKDYWTIK